jgi:peroxiredoxin Q/BCP
MDPGRTCEMTLPRIGKPAPDFRLLVDHGAEVQPSAPRGRPVVQYFYPKDDTPGCTTEASGFRDYFANNGDNATVARISPDTVASHARFRGKASLPFPLLADVGHVVASAYRVRGPRTFTGRASRGVLRTTFPVGPDGRLFRIYQNVKSVGDSLQILADLFGGGTSA